MLVISYKIHYISPLYLIYIHDSCHNSPMDFPCDSSELLVGRNGGAHRVVGQHARGDEASSASEGSVNGAERGEIGRSSWRSR